MSTAQITPVEPSRIEERRAHARRRLGRLSYIHVDQDNGGVLIDISEGGVNFQGVAGLMENEPCVLTFNLPGAPHRFELRGKIAWTNDSRKGGGVQFVDLTEDARLELVQWICAASEHDTPNPVAAAPRIAVKQALPLSVATEEDGENEVDEFDAPLEDSFAAPEVIATSLAESPPALEIPPAAQPEHANARKPDTDSRPAITSGDSQTVRHEFGLRVSENTVSTPAAEPPPHLPKTGVRRERVRISPPRSSARVSEKAIVVADLCMLALVMVVAMSRFGAPISSHAAAVDSVGRFGGASAQMFRVEVRDLNNGRWVLSNDGGTHPVNVDGEPQKSDLAVHTTFTNRSPSYTEPDTQKPPAAPHAVALGLPFQRSSASQGNLDAPVLADGAGAPSPLLVARDSSPTAPEAPAAPPVEAASKPAASGPAVLIHRVDPEYPSAAAVARVSGSVRVSVVVGKDGVPTAIKALSGDPRLASAAVDAVRQWRYTPAQLDGKPTESQIVVALSFQFR